MSPHDTLPPAASPEPATQPPPSTPATEIGTENPEANDGLRTSDFGLSQPSLNPLDAFLDRLVRFFCSLRLTVACLVLGLVLVFAGTLAQVDLGLYKAQNEFFRSWIVYWTPRGSALSIPVLPGGYLVGGVLLVNLVASHLKRFKFTRDKAGIWMVHFGLILLLLGQLGTDMLSRESTLHLREGESRNYSEADRDTELVVIDTTDRDSDKVVAIPQRMLMRQENIRNAELPFMVKVKKFYGNSTVENRAANATEPPPATQGIGPRATVRELPHVTEMDRRDVPSAVIEVATPQGSLGTWLVSLYIEQPQSFAFGGRTYQLALRSRRYYKPFSIQLLKFQHDVYPGTDIPKNFSSRVLLQRPDTGEKREVLIYMNNPLRYGGETFYQSSYDRDNRGSILQVVHNPSWLTPYFSCVLVGAGLVVHFMTHLLRFAFKRRAA